METLQDVTDEQENGQVRDPETIEGQVIEYGIKPPPVRRQRAQRFEKIANAMKVGGSTFFEDKKEGNAFTSFLHRSEIPYTSRSEGNGMRVWKLRKSNKS